MTRTGGQLIVDCLEVNGVERIYCVPGESYLAVLDALHDSAIRTVVCRQEGGAMMMADCEGRLSGLPGICFVTRGPGATNASIGVHIASQDSTPTILFIGQVARSIREREAFQEVDFRAFFGPICKWATEIDDARRIPEILTRAFAVATSGRPGPVVIGLPEDMLTDLVEAPAPLPFVSVETRPGKHEMDEFFRLLNAAERPFMILGGSRWTPKAFNDIAKAAEAWGMPIGCSFRRQALFDELHPCYAGDVGIGINPSLGRYIRESDLLILVGARMGEMPSADYTLIKSPYPDQPLVHVFPDASELGRVYRPTLPIQASPSAFVEAFAANLPDSPPPFADMTTVLHGEYRKWSTPPKEGPGAVQMGPIIEHLEEVLPEDAIITNGAGNYATWIHRFHRFHRFQSQAAPTNGSMGYGTPAAVAAKMMFPEREVVAFAGDGCFMMNGQEFATAVQYGLAITVIVVNNGTFGTIRMHQEREYPGRVSGTDLHNPDFAALARAYGGHGETVTRTEDFAPAFERARSSGKPSIIEIQLDAEAITPTRTLTEIREKR
ncbi:MAG: thiamine pyrophosphate-binding protein [Mesorhizobium amorphae]|nr:MAG: thiamine pyrophosphate-binding protein [Mesorhizobium amorphae]